MVDPNFATKVEIPFSFFLFSFFFSFGKVGEGGIHVEMNFLNSGILEFEWLLGVGMARF